MKRSGKDEDCLFLKFSRDVEIETEASGGRLFDNRLLREILLIKHFQFLREDLVHHLNYSALSPYQFQKTGYHYLNNAYPYH